MTNSCCFNCDQIVVEYGSASAKTDELTGTSKKVRFIYSGCLSYSRLRFSLLQAARTV